MIRLLTDRRRLWIATRVMLLAMASSGAASAQDTATAPAAAPDAGPDQTVVLENQSVVTPEAQAVLDRMTATLAGLQRFQVSADITHDEMLPFGYKMQNVEKARMWVERPNHLRTEVTGDIKQRTYVYDGSQLVTYAPDKNVYAAGAAPKTIGELVTTLLDAGFEMPLIDLLYSGTVGTLTEDVRVGLVVGDSEIDGVMTDHLAFRQPNVDWQLWVEKGSRALPRKLLITTRYEVGDPQYQAVLKWDLAARPDAKAFVFTPPSGATKVPFRTKLVADGGDK